MATTERTLTERLAADRERYTPRGLAVPSIAVARAEGATIVDLDGNEFIDFAGGIGCHNTGHGLRAAVDAIHEQVDRYLHQCFAISMYEPYVDVARKMAELSPCRGEQQKTLLVNSGAEAVENAVKVARAYTGRPGVIAFDRAFHGRTLLTMSLTGKLVYKKGFGPFAPEVYRAPAPYPYRGVTTEDAIDGLEMLFRSDVDPEKVACVVLEPVQGEGGFVVMPEDYPRRLRELCDRYGILYVDDEIQTGIGRTGPLWAIEHYGVEPDLITTGKSIGGGLPLGGVTGRAEVMDAVDPGGLGGTFGGNPVSCAAAIAVLDTVASEEFTARSKELGRVIRERFDAIASRCDKVGEVRGLGSMLAMELVEDRTSKAPATALATKTIAEARERGLLLLACGMYSNVLRVLVPIVIPDADLARGLDVLEDSLQAAVKAS